jgi:hypothetical protein
MSKLSREIFFKALEQKLSGTELRAKMSIILENDPYFIPGYVEHILFAKKHRDELLLRELLRHSKKIVLHLYTNTKSRKYVCHTWSRYEIVSLKELLDMQKEHESSFKDRQIIRIQQLMLDKLFPIGDLEEAPVGKYLRCEKRIDLVPLKNEVQSIEPHWWGINVNRAFHQGSHHQHTHLILLRSLGSSGDQHDTEKYIPTEGVHESKPTEYAERFPSIHNVIKDFAKENNLALGRVAIVRLWPKGEIYRHYDFETNLRGRNRYHLIIQAGKGSSLSIGPETVYPKPGEIWFYANKISHRSNNDSTIPRIHVIFDGYPLAVS